MDPIVKALEEQQAELDGLVAPLDEAGWQRPSRCEGWSVSDVVLHLAQTDELALASVRGDFAEAVQRLATGVEPVANVDDWADAVVAHERGGAGSSVRTRYLVSAAQMRDAFAACDPHERVLWVAGELSARTLATTRLAETWIHTGDVAYAFGIGPVPSDRLRHVARLAWRTLPYAFGRAGRSLTGPVAFELTGPAGDRWDFVPEAEPVTTVRGDALELCLVAGRRMDAARTGLHAEGPDAAAVLELVRTFA